MAEIALAANYPIAFSQEEKNELKIICDGKGDKFDAWFMGALETIKTNKELWSNYFYGFITKEEAYKILDEHKKSLSFIIRMSLDNPRLFMISTMYIGSYKETTNCNGQVKLSHTQQTGGQNIEVMVKKEYKIDTAVYTCQQILDMLNGFQHLKYCIKRDGLCS